MRVRIPPPTLFNLLMKISNFLKYSDLIFLSFLSFFTRFWHLHLPPKVVFDEAHFGLYATKYFSHQYYFDIHPPLGKMLFALAGLFSKIKPGFDFQAGSFYNDFNYLSLRFLPALFGSLFIILVYFFVKELGFSRRTAFLSSFLLLLNNALVVQSRFILMDIILLFFIILSLYLYLLSKKQYPFSFWWYFLNITNSLSLGMTISIKWTGFGALAIIWFLTIFQDKIFSLKKENLIKIFLIFFFPLFIYFLIFSLHFYLLPYSCNKNCGAVIDNYLTNSPPNSQSDSYNFPPKGSLFKKFFLLNKLMLAGNFSSAMFFPYQSDWFEWPFMIRPILYFEEPNNEKTSYIYFLGNPFAWWLAFGGLLFYLYLIARNYFYRFKMNLPENFYSESFHLLLVSFLIFFIPFASIKRFMLLYHYLPALTFSTIIFAAVFDGIISLKYKVDFSDKIFFDNKKADLIFLIILLIIALSFLFFSPLTYGFPLTEKEFQWRMWLSSWN